MAPRPKTPDGGIGGTTTTTTPPTTTTTTPQQKAAQDKAARRLRLQILEAKAKLTSAEQRELTELRKEFPKPAGPPAPSTTTTTRTQPRTSVSGKVGQVGVAGVGVAPTVNKLAASGLAGRVGVAGEGTIGAGGGKQAPGWFSTGSGSRANVDRGEGFTAKAARFANAAWGAQRLSRQAASRDLIRSAMGLPAFVSGGFVVPKYRTDAEGEVITDSRGQPIIEGYEVAPEFRDYQFGPQGPMAQRSGSYVGDRSLRLMTRMSVPEIIKFYQSLSQDELIKVQRQLADAGLFGDNKPHFGFRDDATQSALVNLMRIWGANPDTALDELLASLTREYSSTLDSQVRDIFGEDLAGGLPGEIANITVTDDTTLGNIVDDMAVELYGELLSPERRAALISKIQGNQRGFQTAQAQMDYANRQAISGKGGAVSDLDAFMNALIGQESGGDPTAVNSRTQAFGLGQLTDWDGWAREAGADPSDISEANQRRVIRYKLAQYYAKFGNWRDVAIAWYGGEGAPSEVNSGNWSATRKQGGYPAGDPRNTEPSFNEYADSVLANMRSFQGSSAGGQPTGLMLQESTTQPSDRDAVDAELRALDPNKYFGTRYYKNALTFFELLRSPV